MIEIIPWPDWDNITAEEIDAILGTGWRREVDEMMAEAAAEWEAMRQETDAPLPDDDTTE